MKNTKNVRLAILALAICSAIFGCAKKETKSAKVPDHEDIYAEVAKTDRAQANELMMWALRSDARYHWVELRDKPGVPGTFLVVRHTQPDPKLERTSGNAMN